MKLSFLGFAIFLQTNQLGCGFSIVKLKTDVAAKSTSHRTSLAAATSIPLEDFIPIVQEEEESNVGVLLLNLGGPEKTDDVEGMKYVANVTLSRQR